MAKMSRRDYAAMYGPTTGDAVRLGESVNRGAAKTRLVNDPRVRCQIMRRVPQNLRYRLIRTGEE